jgi:hypothetical protein
MIPWLQGRQRRSRRRALVGSLAGPPADQEPLERWRSFADQLVGTT